MNPTQYLSLSDVIAIHERAMRRVGVDPMPLRDGGLLESAVMRPQMAAWYEGADLVRQAALLGFGISQAQAFLDGNKRTAYLAMVVFLRINGFSYVGNRIELAQHLEQLAERTGDANTAVDEFEAWLREKVRARSEDT
jgi:death on curing protein